MIQFSDLSKELQVALIAACGALVVALITLVWNISNMIFTKRTAKKLELYKQALSKDMEEYKKDLQLEIEMAKVKNKFIEQTVNNRFQFLNETYKSIYTIRKLAEEYERNGARSILYEITDSIRSFQAFYTENSSIAKNTVEVNEYLHPFKQDLLLVFGTRLFEHLNEGKELEIDKLFFKDIIDGCNEVERIILTYLKRYDE